MKKLLLFVLMTAIVATTTMAQEVKDAKSNQVEWEKKVKDELNLTTEQATKFEAVNKEYKDKIDAVMQDASLTKEVKKERKLALKKEKQDKLFEFFTPEQQTKYKELMDKKMKEKASKQGV